MQTKNTRGVQQYEVNAAADALVAERLRPTIERVRQKLGRGSPNTVAPMLETWFAALAPRLGVAADVGREGAMPAEVRNAAEILWRNALSMASIQAAEALQDDQTALNQEKQELAIAQSALATVHEQLAQRETLLREALATAQSRTETTIQRCQHLELEVSCKEAELGQVRDSLSKSVIERDKDRRRFDTQLEAAVKERERLQERAAANERRHLEEVDRARQETKQMRSELTTAVKKLEGVQAELAQTRQRLSQEVADSNMVIAALTEKVAAAELRVKDFQNAMKIRVTTAKAVSRKGSKA